MNETEIAKYMRKDEHASKYFMGVVSYDELPFKSKYPALYIVNTDSSFGPGKHCVCVFVDENMIEYFDSFGNNPKELLQFLNDQNNWYKYSTKHIQSVTSDVCVEITVCCIPILDVADIA